MVTTNKYVILLQTWFPCVVVCTVARGACIIELHKVGNIDLKGNLYFQYQVAQLMVLLMAHH